MRSPRIDEGVELLVLSNPTYPLRFLLSEQVEGSSEGEEVLTDSQRLNYSASTPPPINFVLTEFHVLLLYTNRVIGISILNQAMVFEDFYNEVKYKAKTTSSLIFKENIYMFLIL